jgi:integrase
LAGRRASGEGSIYRRRNGTWSAIATLPDGRRKHVYGKTRDEVRRKLAEILHAVQNGGYTDARGKTLGEFLDQWLIDAVKPRVRAWTFAGYEVHVRVHIKPVLGRVALEKLSPQHVQYLLNRKLEEGLKPKSVRYLRGTLRTALNDAVRWGLVSRNAAALVDGPRVERYDIQPLTPTEARAFLDSINGDRLEALYSVALTMGLRQGEALGLRWQDIDLELGYMRISKQLQRVHGAPTLVEPKTERSRRTLVMPPMITRDLQHHLARQQKERSAAGDRWAETGLVFATVDGKPLDGTAISKGFHRLLERAGLEQRRFHDLRHSCATLLLVQGVSPRVVMDLLGHSQIGLTMNTYSHVIPDLRRDAADRMQDLLGGRER